MISKYKYNNLTWIDLESPTNKEIEHMMDEYPVAHFVCNKSENTSIQPKFKIHNKSINLILGFPELSDQNNRCLIKEIDFIVSNNFVITTHYGQINSLSEFSKTFEINTILEKNIVVEDSGFLLFHIIKSLYFHTRQQADNIIQELEEIKILITKNNKKRVINNIYKVDQKLFDFKKAIESHKGIFNDLQISTKDFFYDNFSNHLSDIINDHKKTESILDTHKETLRNLHDMHNSITMKRKRKIIKRLKIIILIMVPIVIISNIFIINSSGSIQVPIGSYYLILGLIFIISLIIFINIKKRNVSKNI